MLLEQDASRVANLAPIRHGRMLVSPFTFYRGAALIMAADLARTPSSGIYVQCCGDAHVSNFGMFATPERTMAFDVNDFDESHPAPFEWDVMRLVASIVVAGDDNGFSRKSSRAIAQHAATRYREQVRTLSQMNFLDAWYSHVDVRDRLEAAAQTATKSAAQERPEGRCRKRSARPTSAHWIAWRSASTASGGSRMIRRSSSTPTSRRSTRKQLRSFFKQYLASLPKDLLPLMRHYKLDRLRAQGRGRRLGRHRGVRHAAHRDAQQRCAVPADEGGRPSRCSRATPSAISSSTRVSVSSSVSA